jgi:putative YphP/YqiW family bacilliredoxin
MQIDTSQQPTYDPVAVQPMRDELLAAGFEEMVTAQEVDAALQNTQGQTVLVMINSVCGCSAGSARPGVTQALQHHLIPDHLKTVFAGQEKAAVAHLRQTYLGDYPPSSPCIALFRDGKVLFILQRKDIEGHRPEEIAGQMSAAFERECKRPGPSISAEKYATLKRAIACGSKIPKFNDN